MEVNIKEPIKVRKGGRAVPIHEGMIFTLQGVNFKIDRVRKTYITAKPVNIEKEDTSE